MAEVFEECIKIYRNLTQKLPYLVAELERSKKAEKKEKEGLGYFFVTLEKFDEMKKKESYLEFRNIMVINMPQIKINYMKPLKIKVK